MANIGDLSATTVSLQTFQDLAIGGVVSAGGSSGLVNASFSRILTGGLNASNVAASASGLNGLLQPVGLKRAVAVKDVKAVAVKPIVKSAKSLVFDTSRGSVSFFGADGLYAPEPLTNYTEAAKIEDEMKVSEKKDWILGALKKVGLVA